jgi:hypothetical protein
MDRIISVLYMYANDTLKCIESFDAIFKLFRYYLRDFRGTCSLTTIASNPMKHKSMDEVKNTVKNIGFRNLTIFSENLERNCSKYAYFL